MSDQTGGSDRSGTSDREGFGEDQGTRVGRPTPQRDGDHEHPASGHAAGGAARRPEVGKATEGSSSARSTGAGAEAAEGIHTADGARSESDRSALEGKATGGEQAGHRAGSEPISSHDTEHRSRYGGGSRPEDGADTR